MAEPATIIEVRGNTAIVELQPNSGCKSCGLCARHGDRMLLEVDAVPGLEPGQRVYIDGGQKAWAASLLLFIVPIVDLIIGIIVGQVVDIGLPADLASAIFGSTLFGLSLGTVLIWDRHHRKTAKPDRPRIIAMDDQKECHEGHEEEKMI